MSSAAQAATATALVGRTALAFSRRPFTRLFAEMLDTSTNYLTSCFIFVRVDQPGGAAQDLGRRRR